MIFHILCNIVHKIGNKLVEKFKEKAFTLAEIMVALVVIGVITSIILPVAFNNVPNENVMKFKKGNATLAKVINELVSSGEYYKEGDLGIKADGTLINGKQTDDFKYLCKTFADVLSVKTINCLDSEMDYWSGMIIKPEVESQENWNTIASRLDLSCLDKEHCNTSFEITTADNISFYQANPAQPFGINARTYGENDSYIESKERLFGLKKWENLYGTGRGSDVDPIYKVFCMDIDDFNKGENPFGYGIRADGKIILGARAQEWMEKSIQEK